MGRLLVKCEKCGSLYPSGIVTELETLKRDVKNQMTAKTICPFCMHENQSNTAKLILTASAY